MIKIKRVYDDMSQQDGMRILIDRVWPRGVKKEALEHDTWYKDLAPSTALRKWFNHDEDKWEEFQKKYKDELEDHKDILNEIRESADGHNVTLLYAAKDEKHNNAVVLKHVLEN
ncbi:MAG TPA: DUF488 domain-containing protein [Aliicoccus persicus]|uniref:DUF488 domain-containing protein n=1 Tax=Aliicoccus persicus TaxID=930138 RepID=A0A921B6A8_9STAP|nr:DUF488 domain-containing protein [Aliicoccus persicus]